MNEATIENGCAKVPGGEWLMGRGQPVACAGSFSCRTLRGFVVPDRACVQAVASAAGLYAASCERPFLTRLDALPDETLTLASGKLLVAPYSARVGARSVKLVPLSFRRALPVTEFRSGWAVAATRSRVTRVAVADGETLTVRPEAAVAWIGHDPTGFCPKLNVLDMILPRGPRNLAFSFHGPCVVWFEGGGEAERRGLRGRR